MMFDEGKTGYAVWNIVNVWKETRNHFGAANLSELNIFRSGFQDTFCYKMDENGYYSARLDRSLISERCFLPQGHTSYVHSVVFHPNGITFISGSSDSTIKVWDFGTEECLATFQGHGDCVYRLAFHPDGKTFIYSSRDNTIKSLDWKTWKCLAAFQGHARNVNGVAFHSDGKTFISSSMDNTVKSWDVKTG